MPMSPAFKVGQWVKHRAPTGHDNWPVGMVVAHEVYTSIAGSGVWYYVRFIDPDGVADKEPVRLAELEVEAA